MCKKIRETDGEGKSGETGEERMREKKWKGGRVLVIILWVCLLVAKKNTETRILKFY